ncbi:hypothetical protein ACFJZE_15215, partial [Enterococcus faecalis]
RDPKLNQKMLAAHGLAMADGIEVDSDEYFKSLEDTLKINKPEPVVQDEATGEAAKVIQRRSSPAAAPVS